jgi:hypothetical protein
MRWTVVLAACLVLGCGAVEPTRVERAQLGPPPPQFVGPPLVLTSPGSGLAVWVRLDRPLRDNEGALGEYPPWGAGIEIHGAREDIPGMSRPDRYPTCYSQHLDGRFEPGEDVAVALVLSETVRITGTARVQLWESANREKEAVRQLGCPADSATRLCGAPISDRHGMGIWVSSATNASCRRARAVMRSVSRWANSLRCYEKLCVTGHRMNRGFRCDVDIVGEAAWQITCVRGNRIVRGFTAE